MIFHITAWKSTIQIMNFNQYIPSIRKGELIVSITKDTDRLLDQTKTLLQESLENKMKKLFETMSFIITLKSKENVW